MRERKARVSLLVGKVLCTRARSLANVLAGLCRRIGQVSSQGVDLAVDLQPPLSFVFQVKNMDYYKREVSRG